MRYASAYPDVFASDAAYADTLVDAEADADRSNDADIDAHTADTSADAYAVDPDEEDDE